MFIKFLLRKKTENKKGKLFCITKHIINISCFFPISLSIQTKTILVKFYNKNNAFTRFFFSNTEL